MSTGVNPRRGYDASRRREAASQTRHAILDAARELFIASGYVGTTMSAIAQTAGVALDTVYASVGRKPQLFRLLIESALSGTDQAVPAEERDYVRAIRAEPDPARKLELYAHAVRSIAARLGPLHRVLAAAAPVDSGLAELWRDISTRRAHNMRLLAGELEATGRLRPGLSIDVAADIIWAMNAPEFYGLLLGQCGWGLDLFETWLADSWKRLLLADNGSDPGTQLT